MLLRHKPPKGESTYLLALRSRWVDEPYTWGIVEADTDQPFAAFCGQETDATGWFTREEMRALALHPGLRRWLESR